MTDDTHDQSREGALVPIAGGRAPRRLPGDPAPARPTRLLPFGSTTLHARLALLRPRPIRLQADDTKR